MKKLIYLIAFLPLFGNAQTIENLPRADSSSRFDLLIIDQVDSTRGIAKIDLFNGDTLFLAGDSVYVTAVNGELKFVSTNGADFNGRVIINDTLNINSVELKTTTRTISNGVTSYTRNEDDDVELGEDLSSTTIVRNDYVVNKFNANGFASNSKVAYRPYLRQAYYYAGDALSMLGNQQWYRNYNSSMANEVIGTQTSVRNVVDEASKTITVPSTVAHENILWNVGNTGNSTINATEFVNTRLETNVSSGASGDVVNITDYIGIDILSNRDADVTNNVTNSYAIKLSGTLQATNQYGIYEDFGQTLLKNKLTVNDTILLTDNSEADTVLFFDDGDTTRFESDNPIKIGNESLIVKTNGEVQITDTARFDVPIVINGNPVDGLSETPVTLAASATTGGLSLSVQEIGFRAATNAQTGYATAAQITNLESNTTHRTSNGSDHTYIDQSVVSGATPTFTNTNFTEATDKNYVTDAQQTVIGNTSGTNTGDQTSIVGITGTTAEFNTALSDGSFATGGGTATGTNTGDQTITLTSDVTGSGTGSFATTIANDAVTYAKMQNVSAASKLLGRGDSGSGDPQELTLGDNLDMDGTTLDVLYPSGFMDGLTMKWHTVDSVIIQSGKCLSSDGTYNIELSANDTLNFTQDLDADSELADTAYYLYVIYDVDEVNPTKGLMSLSETTPTLPSGYEKSRLCNALINDNGSDIVPVIVEGKGRIKNYEINQESTDLNVEVITGFDDITPTLIPLNTFVPLISKKQTFRANMLMDSDGNSLYFTHPTSSVSSAPRRLTAPVGGKIIRFTFDIITDGQNLRAEVTSASDAVSIYIVNYEIEF